MKLGTRKRLAAQIMKVGKSRVWFDIEKLSEIKEAITKADLRSLIKSGIIKERPMTGVSRGRARKRLLQKKKGRQQNTGSRKGKKTSRLTGKDVWMNKIRAQRELLYALRERESIAKETFKLLYRRAKGNYFRSRSHLMLYLKENNLLLKGKNGSK